MSKGKPTFTPKNNYEWFLYYLFTDTDFTSVKKDIEVRIKELVGEVAYGLMLMLMDKESLCGQLARRAKSEASLDSHHEVLSGPEMEIVKDIELLADKFGVSTTVVEKGLKYSELVPDLTFKTLPLVTTEDNHVVIRLNGSMKLSDIKTVYPFISEQLKELPDYRQRNRSKLYPDLIYAIYKQRLAGLKFKEINTLYENGDLPGYTGGWTIVGEDSLERHYNKYKPAT